MNIKIIASMAILGWVTTASAYGWEDGDSMTLNGNGDESKSASGWEDEGPLILSGTGDEGKVDYEPSCDDQRLRDPSMTDEEYSDFLLAFQNSECAAIFEPGDIGFGGGKVFYVTDEGRHGMEIAPYHHTSVEYGCWNVGLEGARDRSFGAGKSNTDVALENNCVAHYGGTTIFDVLRNFDAGDFRDWYIPSYGELEEIYKVLGPYLVTERSNAHPSFPQYFWSSSESNGDWMWALNLTTGKKALASHPVKLSVLLIRNF